MLSTQTAENAFADVCLHMFPFLMFYNVPIVTPCSHSNIAGLESDFQNIDKICKKEPSKLENLLDKLKPISNRSVFNSLFLNKRY